MDISIETLIRSHNLCIEKSNSCLLQQGPHGELNIANVIKGYTGTCGSLGEAGPTGFNRMPNPVESCSVCLVYKNHKIHDPECSLCATYKQHFNCEPECEVCVQHQQHNKSKITDCPQIVIKEQNNTNETILNAISSLINLEFSDSVICNNISHIAIKGDIKPEFEQQLQQLQSEHNTKYEIYQQRMAEIRTLESQLENLIKEYGGELWYDDEDYYSLPEPMLNVPKEWYNWTYRHSMCIVYLPESPFGKLIEPFCD